MQNPGRLWPGSIVRVVVDFVDPNNTPGDPATVTFSTLSPACQRADYVFGSAAQVTNPQVGRYVLAIPSTSLLDGGRWRWRVVTTGATYAYEGNFVAQESRFVNGSGWGDYPL